MRKILVLAAIVALSGCARFSTTQKDIRYDEETGRPSTTVTTKATAYTFFQGKSQLAEWKASQTEGEQGAEVGSLSQETTGVGDQISVIVEAITRGLVEGLAK